MAHLGHLSTETKSHGKEYILLPLQQDENKQAFWQDSFNDIKNRLNNSQENTINNKNIHNIYSMVTHDNSKICQNINLVHNILYYTSKRTQFYSWLDCRLNVFKT